MSQQNKITKLNMRFYSPTMKQLKIVDFFKRISPKKISKDKTDSWLGWPMHEMSGEDGFCWKCQQCYPNNQLCIY
jgi:hypothetical protein